MKNFIKLFTIVALSMSVSSCSTLFSGKKDRLIVNCNVPNADVYIDGELRGKANEHLTIERRYWDYRTLTVRAEGYEDATVQLETKVAAAYWMNLFNVFIFAVVDVGNGSAAKLKYNEHSVTLDKVE